MKKFSYVSERISVERNCNILFSKYRSTGIGDASFFTVEPILGDICKMIKNWMAKP